MFRYNIIYNAIRKDILDGVYGYNTLIPSENRMSREFGVERATVRKALELLVEEGLIEKCPGIGSKVIYKENGGADTTAAAQPHDLMGFFILDSANEEKKITEPYYADLFYFCERECQARNCQLIYISVDQDTDILGILNKYNFMAAFFVTRMPEGILEKARMSNTPIILVNEQRENMVSIFCDHEMCATLALKHFAEMGHVRIAAIAGPKGFLASDLRLRSCYASIHSLQIDLRPEWIVRGDWTYSGGYEATKQIFPERAAYDPQKQPTAIYVFNDMMALGVLRALDDLGYAVPGDISVIGTDNMAQLKYTVPDLTTIDGSTEYLARVIIDSAYKNAFGIYDRGCSLRVPVQLIKRKTVRDLKEKEEQ